VLSRRYLLAVLVYNGRDVVLPCIDSVARLIEPGVDVMVFDDCSPSPGWSEELAAGCAARGIGYYRSPRNLGIPRNMSLAMSTGMSLGYDVIGLVNSDVILPLGLCSVADEILNNHTDVASITPWSNNVSAFSLPLEADPELAAGQQFVDDFSDALRNYFGTTVIEIPTGVGYCMLLTADAIRSVGLMDPIFGRGYCEEVDWCQRVIASKRKNVLAIGSYVFHAGSGTNRTEGLLAHGMTTVPEHERIILGRYPDYIDRVRAFLDLGKVERLGAEAVAHVFSQLCRDRGYTLVVSELDLCQDQVRPVVTLRLRSETSLLRLGSVQCELPTGRLWQPEALCDQLGKPSRVLVYEPGPMGAALASWARTNGIEVAVSAAYPAAVLD
jgi:GT2 family glycosyltransferase